jgi:hypothetical protein
MPNTWLTDPPFVLFRFLANEMAVAGLTRNAIAISEMSPWIFEAATDEVRRTQSHALAAFEHLKAQLAFQSEFASKEIQQHFRTTSAHSAIAIWAGIETAIERMLLNHIQHLSSSKQTVAASVPTLKLEKLHTAVEADARTLRRKWEAALDESGALDRALKMLAVFDLKIEISEDSKQKLSEMAEIRNVLLHRGGIVDTWFVTKCSWLNLNAGDELIIDEAKLAKFNEAALEFARALADAVTKSPHLFAGTR